jgi:Tfp pilus assembly protein PilF
VRLNFSHYKWALPVVLAFIAALPSLRFDFSGDDSVLILENKNVQGVSGIPALWRSDFFDRDVVGLPGYGGIGYYRPLTTTSFAIDWTIWERNPFGFHLCNSLLHAVVVFLVYLLAVSLGISDWAALFAAALFAVFPSHAQAVALVNARSDLLCTFGALLACLGALRSSLLLMCLGTFIGIFSKETGIWIPLLCTGILWTEDKRDRRTLFMLVLPWLLLLAYLSARVGTGHAFSSLDGRWTGLWFRSVGTSLGVYMLSTMGFDVAKFPKLLFIGKSVVGFRAWVPWIVYLTMLGMAGTAIWKKKIEGVIWLWLGAGFLFLLAHNAVQVPGMNEMLTLQARWTYFPAVGLVLLLFHATNRYLPSRRLFMFLPLMAAIFLGLYWIRLSEYKNDRTQALRYLDSLQKIALEELPVSTRAVRLELEGMILAEEGDLKSAEERLRAALKYSTNSSVQANLGSVLMEQGRLSESVEILRSSLLPTEIQKSGHIEYIVSDAQARGRPARYAILAEALSRLGRLPEAEENLENAHRGDPYKPEYMLNLGSITARQKKLEKARSWYEQALAFRPCYGKAIEALEAIGQIQRDAELVEKTKTKRKECRLLGG